LKTYNRNHRVLRVGAALVLLSLAALPAQARGKSEAWSRTQFTTAERLREALNGRPAQELTQHDYQRVINAYRRVYYAAPTSSKADASVVAVAELLAEMGRRLESKDTLRKATGQYEFLRREYPGSKYRFNALYTIGEIYKDDLEDPVRARGVFEEFLRRYPRNHLAEEARKALAEPVQQASLKSQDKNKDKDAEDSDDSGEQTSATASSTTANAGREPKSGKLPRVTDVRHWSKPDYTRVAIDLEQNIKYESQRIDRPDRIVFDLLDSKLSSRLLGKTFDVNDGLLKKVRVAQFQPGKTRVVLEVDDLSDYDSVILSNPSRLIINIHGKDAQSKRARDTSAKEARVSSQNEVTTSSAIPAAKAPTDALKLQPVLQVKTESKKPVESLPVSNTSAPNLPSQKAARVNDGANEVLATLQPPPNIAPPGLKPASGATPSPVPAPPEGPSLGRPSSSNNGPGSKNRAAKGKHKSTPTESQGREALPTASGDRSLIRALGLKIGRIVIDPGHGGHDAGTIGPNGLEEKDLVLDVGRRLGKLLEARLGADVVYTRNDDTFVPLETRTAIANQEQADLFVSIHANSSRDPDARGVETYYLNFTSSREALDVAARENAVSEESIHELQDLVKKIALREKIDESREFATDVQRSLHSGLAAKSPGIRNRGVKKAPFIVLIGANMPSILAEISFVSNPGDERRLGTAEYRQRVAESLYRGIAKYVSGLSGVKVASKMDKSVGP
jgi:N-acetylmuramoyl-L-alanine amidase